jgi:hypothetical protein
MMDAALTVRCLDISESKTRRGRMPAHRLSTARRSPADREPARGPTITVPDLDRQPAPAPGRVTRTLYFGQDAPVDTAR